MRWGTYKAWGIMAILDAPCFGISLCQSTRWHVKSLGSHTIPDHSKVDDRIAK